MEVKDRYSVTYLIFCLLGLGSLLPWSFFITARDYWMYKLGDFNATVSSVTTDPFTVTEDLSSNSTVSSKNTNASTTASAGSETQITTLRGLFMNSLAVCSMLPNVIFQFLNTLLHKRIPQNIRILSTLSLMILLFIFTEVMVMVDTSAWQDTFFTITLVSVVVLNSFSAIFQSSVFGLAARFPLKYSGAVMVGQAVGGIFAAVAMIISLAFGSNPTDSAFIFFLTAIAVLAVTMVCYVLLTKLRFYKLFVTTPGNEKSLDGKDLKLEQSRYGDQEEVNFLPSEQTSDTRSLKVENGDEASEKSDSTSMSVPLLHIVSKIWLHMFCVTYTFFITIACFPAVTAGIKPASSGTTWTDVYFTPVCCFLTFNIVDWIGRMSASYIHIPSSKSRVALLLCVLARTVFPFLFALCNYQPRSHLPVVFKKDAYFIVFMVPFAFSNGHLTTLSMQYGPKQVELENSATAGSMLAFTLTVGLFAGAGTSFLVTSLI